MYDDYWGRERYTPAAPRAVKGGIKADKQRGAFAQQWWGKKWIQTLERTPGGARLQRGRSYARKGQVVDLQITGNTIRASVQGTSAMPYGVTIEIQKFTDELWDEVVAEMLEQPLVVAGLMQGEIPEEIDQLFAQHKTSLLPERFAQMQTRCSCPDSANPCKHIAAVYYLLAEALDKDPFIIFKLRGLDRDAFMQRLQNSYGYDAGESEQPREYPQELPVDPLIFWDYKLENGGQRPLAQVPAVDAALPKRLGSIPLWRSEARFLDLMEEYYRSASRYAVQYAETMQAED